MDYTSIFNSDFFTMTLLNLLSPIELYHLRSLTKYINTHITLNHVNDKIISNIIKRLKYKLKDKYTDFINIAVKRKMCLYGLFITECIWEEYHCPYIDIKMLENDMHGVNNVFTDLKKVKPNTDTFLYYQFNGSFLYESDLSTILDNIRLYIISDTQYHNKNFPTIFNNTLVINNGLNGWQLTIGDIKRVMCKIDSINDDYYNYSWFHHEQSERQKILCDRYNITLINN